MIEILKGGVPGKPGKSAYEIAVQNGFEGTEQEWLESLQGKDGDAGPQGAQGEDGIPGADGSDGAASGQYMVWEPPEMGNMRSDLPDMIFDAYGDYDPMRAYSQLWDALMGQEPGWITRTELGKDGTDTYPVYMYDFNPGAYDKKVIVIACIHGSERLGQYAAWFFFDHLLRHWEDRTDLSYCRNKVRWIVIPNCNPWGYKNQSRVTASGVNINRNFDYLWDLFPVQPPPSEGYKGPSVWSEVETRLIRDAVIEHSDAVAMVDCHFFGGPGNRGHYPVYVPAGDSPGLRTIMDVVNELNVGAYEGSVEISRVYDPISVNWANKEFGMFAPSLEFDSGHYTPSYGPACNTAATRFYGNILLAAASLPGKTKARTRREPRAGIATYNRAGTDVINVNWTTAAEIQAFRVTIPDVHYPAILHVNGFLNIFANGPLTFHATPYVIQARQGKFGPLDPNGNGFWNTVKDSISSFEHTFVEGQHANRTIVPFCITIPVMPTKAVDGGVLGVGPLIISMRAYSTTGTTYINKMRLNWLIIPCDLGDRAVEVYSCDGRTAEGINAMQVIRPYY